MSVRGKGVSACVQTLSCSHEFLSTAVRWSLQLERSGYTTTESSISPMHIVLWARYVISHVWHLG